jgi:hypothetical protein
MWGDPGVARVNVQDQIAALAAKTPSELASDYTALFGHAPRRRHPDYLRKRIAHRLQTNAHGGLSRVARVALERLVGEIQLPTNTATTTNADAKPSAPRVLTRVWHGATYRVVATSDGAFEWDGKRFGSLSAVAFAITGAKWNGRLFFNLTQRGPKA